MKKITFIIITILTCWLSLDTLAQSRTQGTGKKADKGSGKYVGAIYWLSFGRGQNEALQNGDKAVFKTPQGLTYTVTVSNIDNTQLISGTNASYYKPLCASKTTDWDVGTKGNNFPYAYGFNNPDGNDERIGLKVYGAIAKFDLTLTVTDEFGAKSNYGNIVIAGTESLNGQVDASNNKTESYSLQVDPNEDTTGKHIPSLNVIESYVYKNNFSNLALQVDVEEIYEATGKEERLTVSNPVKDNSRGDVIIAATNVHKIRAIVKSTNGGQHFAIGVLDLGDRGDLPKSFEYAPTETVDGTPDAPAVHINAPIITTPNDAEAPQMLANGTYYFVGKSGKTHFTDASGNALGNMATLMKPRLRIGTLIDFEEVANYTPNADGDDRTNENDEDGVETILVGCSGVVGVYNATPAEAYLHYWIDLNEDGHFDETNEHGMTVVPANHYNQQTIGGKTKRTDKKFYFNMQNVWDKTPKENHNYKARFRLSTEQNQKYYGLVDQGEVEDYVIQFVRPMVEVNHNLACPPATGGGKITVKSLPKTGWKIVFKKTGTVFKTVTSYEVANNPTFYELDNLAKGSYEAIITNNDPNSCEFIEAFEITDPTATECNKDVYTQDCPSPTKINYPATAPSGVTVDLVNSKFTEGTISSTDGQLCGVNASGKHRILQKADDRLVYKFDRGITTVDVWLLVMGNNNNNGWYGEDSAVFEAEDASGNAVPVTLSFATTDCKGRSIINGNTVTTQASQTQANLSNFSVSVTSATPFTTLRVINPEERVSATAKKKGYGFYSELCLESIDGDADGDGILDSEDLDDDNDGILDEDESNKVCKDITIGFKRPSVEKKYYITDPNSAVDTNESSYCTFLYNTSYLVLKFDQEYPANTEIKFRGYANYGNIAVQESTTNGNWSSQKTVTFSGSGIVNGSTYKLTNNARYLKITRPGSRAYLADVKAIETATICHIENVDTDGDGIPNHLDLDSDGDGCPDALEANSTLKWEDLANDNSIDISKTHGVNLKGVPNGKEATDEGKSQDDSQQADACDPCDANKNSSLLDSDGDGIGNACDLDDDNDGILDTDEGCGNKPASPFVLQKGESRNGPTGVGKLVYRNAEGYKVVLSAAGTEGGTDGQTPNFGYNGADGTIITNKDTGHISFEVSNGEKLDQPKLKVEAFSPQGEAIDIISIAFGGIENMDNLDAQDAVAADVVGKWSNLTLHGNTLGCAQINVATGDATPVSGVTQTELNGFSFANLIAQGAKSEVIFNNHDNKVQGPYNATFSPDIPVPSFHLIVDDLKGTRNIWTEFEAATIEVAVKDCSLDTDGDGIPDALDLDSDNDGCSDAKEGAKDFTSFVAAAGTLTDGNGGQVTENLGSTVDSNGIPNNADGGQGIGQATSAEINDCKDIDKDGVPDWLDLDNDNDGILDTEENKICATLTSSEGTADTNTALVKNWSSSDFEYFVHGRAYDASGYIKSGFANKLFTDKIPYNHYNTADDFTVTNTSGDQKDRVITFENGTITYKGTGTLENPVAFGEKSDDPIVSGTPKEAVYIEIKQAVNAGDKYAVNINFTKPVKAFSFDANDILDPASEGADKKFRANIYVDSKLQMYFKGNTKVGGNGEGSNPVTYALYDAETNAKVMDFPIADESKSSFGFVSKKGRFKKVTFEIQLLESVEKSAPKYWGYYDWIGIDNFVYSFDCDTDGDGTPNYLDLDSDNDGCSDAKEGAKDIKTFETAQSSLTDGNGNQVTENLGNTVDGNGVPNSATGGQGIGGSEVALKYEITQQLSNVDICENGDATFNVIATTTPAVSSNYKWQVSTDGTNWLDIYGESGTVESGKKATLTVSPATMAQSGKQYRVFYYHDDNSCGKPSDIAILTVHPQPKFTVNGSTANCYDEASKIEIEITSGDANYEFWLLPIADDGTVGSDKIKLKSTGATNTYQFDNTGEETHSITKTSTNKKITIKLKQKGKFKVMMRNKDVLNCNCNCK